MIESLDRLTKGAELMIHSGVLMREEISSLRAANEAASRRRSYKRKRIQKNGILKIGEGAQLIALKGLSVELDNKNGRTKGCVDGSDPPQRRCRRCSNTGHNSHTCKYEAESK